MGAPYFNILHKCDKALVAYLVSLGAGTIDDVVTAKRSQVKFLPVTTCESHNADPLANNLSGEYEVDASISVRTSGLGDAADNAADVPATQAGDRVAKTFDAFNIVQDQSGEALATAINAAATSVSDFKMLDVQVRKIRAGFEAKGDAWCDIIDLKIICCPNDSVV